MSGQLVSLSSQCLLSLLKLVRPAHR